MAAFLTLALSLCRQDILDRFAGSALGSLWVFIWPLVQLFIYIVIFGKLMGARLGMSTHIYSYGFYIASGLLCWTLFANSVNRCSRSFIERSHIIRKVKVNLAVLPAAVCMGELLPFFAGLAFLGCADLIAGWRPSLLWLGPLCIALYSLIIFAYGLGVFFACLTVFARDMTEVAGIALQVAFWFTPIVYTPSILPDWLANILWINPMTGITGVFQNYFVLNGSVDWLQILYALGIAHFTLFLGLWTLTRWRKALLDVV